MTTLTLERLAQIEACAERQFDRMKYVDANPVEMVELIRGYRIGMATEASKRTSANIIDKDGRRVTVAAIIDSDGKPTLLASWTNIEQPEKRLDTVSVDIADDGVRIVPAGEA